MRVTTATTTTLTYLHSDHLGSTSLATSEAGVELYRRGYYPFGEERYAVGVAVTDYGFTGQREEAGFGLYDYNARYYDPGTGRFVSPDTIVPGARNAQAWNRYAYVLNNPLKHVDPSGHRPLWDGPEPPPTPQPTPVPEPDYSRADPGPLGVWNDGVWWVPEGGSAWQEYDAWEVWVGQPQPWLDPDHQQTVCHEGCDFSEVDAGGIGIDVASIAADLSPVSFHVGLWISSVDLAVEAANYGDVKRDFEEGLVTESQLASARADVVYAGLGFIPMLGSVADGISIVRETVLNTEVVVTCASNPSYIPPPESPKDPPTVLLWWPH
jgi:RHS repeat-associated protein